MASGPQEEITPDENKECFVMDEDKNEIIIKAPLFSRACRILFT